MDTTMEQKLNAIRSDYQAVAGSPFSHFYCPILFRDEFVDLCRAHIVNRACPESSRNWTIQRADIDNFFGSVFEGDFVDIRHRGKHLPDDIIVDPGLSKKFRPKIHVGGEVVPHFVAHGPMPKHFTEAVVVGPSGPVRLGLKIDPDDASAAIAKGCEIVIEKDVRLPALVSLLKAAHLTLFEMLGYRYALSLGGYFLGKTVLGDFFLRNRDLPKAEVIVAATAHFQEFANLVRPALSTIMEVQGTVSDGFVFVCRCGDDTPWAFIVFVRTSDLLHAVLVPVLDTPSASARFVEFLRGDGGAVRANRCRFKDDKWFGSSESEILNWPRGEFL